MKLVIDDQEVVFNVKDTSGSSSYEELRPSVTFTKKKHVEFFFAQHLSLSFVISGSVGENHSYFSRRL